MESDLTIHGMSTLHLVLEELMHLLHPCQVYTKRSGESSVLYGSTPEAISTYLSWTRYNVVGSHRRGLDEGAYNSLTYGLTRLGGRFNLETSFWCGYIVFAQRLFQPGVYTRHLSYPLLGTLLLTDR